MNLIDLLLLAQAASPAPEGAPQPSFLVSIMPLIFVFVIFYFLLIRPQQRRRSRARDGHDHEQLMVDPRRDLVDRHDDRRTVLPRFAPPCGA